MKKGRSAQDVAAENVERLRKYLSGIEALPSRGGQLNATAVARACGFDRGVLYQNPECKRLLNEALAAKGLRGLEEHETPAFDDRKRQLEQLVTKLEQRNAALKAENDTLRDKLKRLHHVEAHMIATGRIPR